jgi:hypothetical protein
MGAVVRRVKSGEIILLEQGDKRMPSFVSRRVLLPIAVGDQRPYRDVLVSIATETTAKSFLGHLIALSVHRYS